MNTEQGSFVLQLPDDVRLACERLFAALPPERAMPDLLPKSPANREAVTLAAKAVVNPALMRNTHLVAGVWLYVDEIELSHTACQDIEDESGALWHAIVHRREGDFSNSRYWLARVGRHPAMSADPSYDAEAFLNEVASSDGNPPQLVEVQRREWQRLFLWCALNPQSA